MTGNRKRWTSLVTLALVWLAGTGVIAQITTGTVAGTIKDAQGGVIPGATVVLISESRGTRSGSSSGSFAIFS